jgi:mediator of RNA polymerase II transcription subunit 10
MDNSQQSNYSARLANLEQSLEAFQENARQMAVITSNFQSNSQDALNHKLHSLITGLQELDSTKHSFHDIPVPIELLDRLHAGNSPQMYTKDVIERTAQKNKQLNGKQKAYENLRDALLVELSSEMPRETMQYRGIRDRVVVARTGDGVNNDSSPMQK